jgi:hypothetical protein
MNPLISFFQHFYQSALRKDKHEWEIIIYCVGTAALFWFLNAMGKVYHHQLSIPIEYQYNGQKYIAISSLPKSIQVEVEGRGWDLLRQMYSWDSKVFYFKIERPFETQFLLPSGWKKKISELLPAVKVQAVVSDSIFCRFDTRSKKLVGLYVDLQDIRLRPGYQISSPIRISPKFIEFEGATSLVDRLPAMLPVKVDARNISESFDQNVAIDFSAEYPKNELLRYNQDAINVQFYVRPSLEEEIEVPIQVVNAEKHPELFLKERKVTVTFLISEQEKAKLSTEDFLVQADLDGFNPADSTIEVKLVKSPKLVSDAQLGIVKTRVYAR